MNKFIIFSSFIFVIIIHFSILNYFKTSKIQNSQTQDNNPILLQIAKIEPKTETKVEVQKEVVIIEKKVEKPITKPTPIKQVEKPLPIKTASLVKEEIIENKNLKNSEVVQKTETHSNEEKIEKENEYLKKYKTELREEINKNTLKVSIKYTNCDYPISKTVICQNNKETFKILIKGTCKN